MDITRYNPETQKLIEKAMEDQMALDPKSIETLNEIRDIAEEQKDEGLLGFAYYYLANTYYTLEMDYQLYRENLGTAIRHLLLANDNELLTRAYNFIGVDASNNGSYDISYYYYMLALHTCEDLGNEYLFSIVNANIGQLYVRLGDYATGREYIRKSSMNEDRSDDLYYYHNLLNGMVLDGTTSIKMGDLESAIEMDRQIQEMEEQLSGGEGINEVRMSALFFRAQVALLREDKDLYRRLVADALEELLDTHLIFDFIEDIYDFCMFLLEKGETEPVRQILDNLWDTIEDSGVNHMIRLFADIRIAYYEKIGDRENANTLLRKIHMLSDEQRKEQNKLYMYSMQLIDTMDEMRRERERMVQENERLQYQATTDPLTGMPNRLAMVIALDDMFHRAIEKNHLICVEILDIDMFKDYNDTFGHSTGDKCLKAVASVMMEIAERSGISCARYGGDEFVFIYEDMTADEIVSTARELGERVADLQINNPELVALPNITISQGLCLGKPKQGSKHGDYMEIADNALYDVKRSGRKQGMAIRNIEE